MFAAPVPKERRESARDRPQRLFRVLGPSRLLQNPLAGQKHVLSQAIQIAHVTFHLGWSARALKAMFHAVLPVVNADWNFCDGWQRD
jgi:hypothetical protein